MSRFFFIDQSLKGIGGHHYDYALHIVNALTDMGIPVFLAAHRSFRATVDFPATCRIVPLFRHTVYSGYSEISPAKRVRAGHRRAARLSASRTDGGNLRVEQRQDRDRQKMVASFRRECSRLFDLHPLAAGDQVFFATISDLELQGLAAYLDGHEVAPGIDWHCQFHFNIFQGRPHEYESQRAIIDELRNRFATAMQSLRKHAVHFYNTSEELADQYQRLAVADFRSLAYPINPKLNSRNAGESDEPRARRPLRATLAGAVRHEKGQRGLGELVRNIGSDLFERNELQLVVQRKRRWGFRRPQIDLSGIVPPAKASRGSPPIEFADYPLSKSDYERLLRSADIGLFLYDGRTYYARRAGVLGEFFARGIPTIVPAGCWLSQQLGEINNEYVEHRIRSSQSGDLVEDSAVGNETGRIAGRFSGTVVSGKAVAIQLQIKPTDEQVALQWHVRSPHTEPQFAIATVLQEGPQRGEPISHILRSPDSHSSGRCPPAGCILPLPRDRTDLRLHISCAYGCKSIDLGRLDAFALAGPARPTSRVGLCFASAPEIPRLLREMVEHYEHYRNTARWFATKWYASHDPRLVVASLLQRSRYGRRSAA